MRSQIALLDFSAALSRAVATARRAFAYGGIFELFGSAAAATKSVFVPLAARLFRLRVPVRYWPSFSPELLAMREYRCGNWFAVDQVTARKRRLRTLADLCQASVAARDVLVREDAPNSSRVTRDAERHSAITCGEDDQQILRHYFRAMYKDFAVTLVPLTRDDAGDFLIVPPTSASCKVTVVIPTRDHVALLRVAIDAVVNYGGHDNLEIIVIDNGSRDAITIDHLQRVSAAQTVRVLRDDEPFNWSRINNLAARSATGDVLVFLNNDVQAIHHGWLKRISAFATMSGVGCVGPMLLYPDNSIQHAGVVVGMGRWADHIHKFGDFNAGFDSTPFVPPSVTRPVLALTGACLAISRASFERLGGFDETFQIVFSDVELCVRAHANGLRNLYLGDVRLYHHESKSRDPKNVPDSDFHSAYIALEPYRSKVCDPYFHPRLDKLSLTPKSDLLATDLSKWMRS